jgi:rhodanese-related sulfurtransferase
VKQRKSRPPRNAGRRSAAARGKQPGPAGRSPSWTVIGAAILVVAIALVAGVAAFSGSSGANVAASTSPVASVAQGTSADIAGWTDIDSDELAATLQAGDVTLLNVKTPYIGEIEGTDLYIPYTDLVARATELPADRNAPIVVYCRTGNQSVTAAQTLVALGYTNIENLVDGMTGWVASGRGLIQLDRS